MCCVVLVFFFKQKTAYEMRISDWSSDVFSSDLRRVEHNHNIRINEPMPKHILERIAGPNVVRVQEYVESAGRKEIVKLQRSCSGFHPPIAHKNPSLSTK